MVCLGFKPAGYMLVGTDKTTEQWRPPQLNIMLSSLGTKVGTSITSAFGNGKL